MGTTVDCLARGQTLLTLNKFPDVAESLLERAILQIPKILQAPKLLFGNAVSPTLFQFRSTLALPVDG